VWTVLGCFPATVGLKRPRSRPLQGTNLASNCCQRRQTLGPFCNSLAYPGPGAHPDITGYTRLCPEHPGSHRAYPKTHWHTPVHPGTPGYTGACSGIPTNARMFRRKPGHARAYPRMTGYIIEFDILKQTLVNCMCLSLQMGEGSKEETSKEAASKEAASKEEASKEAAFASVSENLRLVFLRLVPFGLPQVRHELGRTPRVQITCTWCARGRDVYGLRPKRP
jgi:hypothetical protein